ncbi:MAG: hypothetical protein AB1798_02080, partial [Spirochaetota bacterium]
NIHEIIRDLAENKGMGILMISDEILDVQENCNRILVMSKGKIVAEIEEAAKITEEELLNLVSGKEGDGVKSR